MFRTLTPFTILFVATGIHHAISEWKSGEERGAISFCGQTNTGGSDAQAQSQEACGGTVPWALKVCHL